jgi:hypothetical protein
MVFAGVAVTFAVVLFLVLRSLSSVPCCRCLQPVGWGWGGRRMCSACVGELVSRLGEVRLVAWDDADPDGDGEPGDMRYDYERTRMRMELDREIRRRLAERRAEEREPGA